MKPYKRTLHEVVEVLRDCEVGKKGERAVVVSLEAPHYMTLVFFDRAPDERIVKTGADYIYLRGV